MEHEIEDFNALLVLMKKDLSLLIRSLKGEVLMTFELEALQNHLKKNTVPPTWLDLSPELNLKLSEWVEHLRMRNEQYLCWVS